MEGAFNGGLFSRGAIMYQCSGGVLWGLAHSRGTVSGKIVFLCFCNENINTKNHVL